MHAGPRIILGRILDLATTSLRIWCEHMSPEILRELLATRLLIDVRLDGPRGTWAELSGVATGLRHGNQLVIRIDDPSEEVDVRIEQALADALRPLTEVMVVDPDGARRSATADAFRAVGCNVIEAATPYGAIARLEGTRPRVIAVADTTPSDAARELRRHLRLTLPGTRVIATGDGATSVAREPWLCTSGPASIVEARILALLCLPTVS